MTNRGESAAGALLCRGDSIHPRISPDGRFVACTRYL